MSVQNFYDSLHSNPEPEVKYPFLYHKLRRFELGRVDAACIFIKGGNTLLDIGCGDGQLLFKVKDKYRDVWGIDIAQSAINRVTARAGHDFHVHARTADVNSSLDFPDSSFDTVTALAVLEHVFDPYHFVNECYRLLNPKGLLIIEVPNVAFLPNRLRLLFGFVPRTSDPGVTGYDAGHLHYFTRKSLRELIEMAGFKVLTVTSCGIFAGIRRIWGSLLCGDILLVAMKP